MRCRNKFPKAFLIAVLSAGSVSALYAQPNPAATPDFFENKIRPVLAGTCYGCHTDSAMGGLRLDSRDAVLKGGGRGPAVVPGDPEKSLLVHALRQDGQIKMPLGGGKLPDSQIADVAAWIKAGAVWPQGAAAAAASNTYVIAPERRKFWSFLPLREVPAPAVRDSRWPKTPIDHFVLARLEKEGLKPVRLASRRDLIRRATLDLTGLPPAPEEIAAFENDRSPDAFAKVVDRLLASPHYGERWGRIWLDVARFGEDDYRSLDPMRRGYNPYPNAFLYRDWVIQAFNDDMPYDQFVKAQIAGDLMDEKVRYKMLPATGFLGLGPWYYDNGAVEVTHADERHDRVDVVTRGFLGLTVACARCHDHKYDPIPQKDYYALAGVFFNTIYHEYPRAPKSVIEESKRIEDEIEKKQQILQEMQNNLSTGLAEGLALQTSNYLRAVWEVSGPEKKDMGAVVEARKLDYELLARWVKYMERTTDRYHNKDAWQAFMKKGGGKASDAGKLADEFQQNLVRIMLARKELNDENDVIAAKALEGTKKKKRANKPNEFVTNDDFCPGCSLQLKNLPLDQTTFWTEIFQREISDSDDPTVMMAEGKRQPNPGVLLFRGWGLETRVGAAERAQLDAMKSSVAALKKKLEPGYPYLHGVEDAPHPHDLELAIRGNPQNLGPEVPRHFLSVLSPGDPAPFAQGSGRLELAQDIVRQPIAMRVIVNRIWKEHFGTGITDTPSNFGFGGERPTNPELLEYLANDFAHNGMSIKQLHREIMLSSVYQLSTENDDADFAKDSGDRLYWRMDRRRMDAEQVRDSILDVAGNLDTSMGGPSAELTPGFTRRTVYGKVSRYHLDEYLQLFDFPTPAISAEKRFTTTVPLQRLFLMNSDFVQIESEKLAQRVAAEPDNRARIKKLYLLAYGRGPSETEIQLGLDYLHSEPMREYEENKKKEADKEAGPKKGDEAPVVSGAANPEPSAPPADEAAGEGAAGAAGADGEAPPVEIGMGMMGGVLPKAKRTEIKYEPTVWGRYVKVLLSSSEFVFIN
jgi:mono/diheme cytochrome c family protein